MNYNNSNTVLNNVSKFYIIPFNVIFNDKNIFCLNNIGFIMYCSLK